MGFLAFAPTASAVLLTLGDGTGNTTPPPADPGFDHIGVINGLSGVYVRNGWVLTANHVGENAITLGGVTYQPVIGSEVRFQNADATLADLIAFRLTTEPPLAGLLITNSAPTLNSMLTLVGNGRDRGAATTFMGNDGFSWASGRTLRWGTNRISHVNQLSLDTQAFWITYDESPTGPGSQDEADVVSGDSGGAAFTGSGTSAELVGILFARAGFQGQPANTSIFGNVGIISNLFAYRDDILEVIDQPACDDGLDEDGDGLSDYPADPGCAGRTDTSETGPPSLACDNGLDDDGDGFVDLNDPSCTDPFDLSEKGPAFQCDNGIDDDGDLAVDFPDDPECLQPTTLTEVPEPASSLMLTSGLLALFFVERRRLFVERRRLFVKRRRLFVERRRLLIDRRHALL